MLSEKQKVTRQHQALFEEFKKWEPLFRDVRDFINPYIGFFDGEESNSGKRMDDKMLRTMNIKYNHIFAAGLQSGVTSPTRPWIKLVFKDPALMQNPNVLNWLNLVKDITLDVLQRGNFYPENHKFYLELGCFCTAAMLIEEDEETVIHCHTFTAGEYALGCDHKGRYNQFARTIKMTAEQMVEKFGEDNVPNDVKQAAEDANSKKTYDVKHLIAPNPDYDPHKVDQQSMKFRDYYWMRGGDTDKWLRKGGFATFPIMAMPYYRKGADIYGTGPGIWSLGDAKQIQLMWSDMCTATELAVKPPWQAPVQSLQGAGINALPSGVNFYNSQSGGNGDTIKPLFQVNFDLNAATAMQQAVEECIKEHFFVNGFQLLSEMEKGQRTAREVIELTAEKMSQIGPLLEALQSYLNMIVDRVIDIGFRLGIYPQPPDEIQGIEMQVEFVSSIAMAQKQEALVPIMDTVNAAISMATSTQRPEILDKIDFDEVIDQTSNLNGGPPSIVVSDEQVAAIREQRAQQQQAMMQMQQAAQAAEIAKSASQANMDGDNALTKVAGALGGSG